MPDLGWWGYVSGVLPALTTLAGLIAAILAWVAKIRWSQEFKEAKEAEIASLKTQISGLQAENSSIKNIYNETVNAKLAQIQLLERYNAELRELNPVILRDYYKAAIELINNTTKAATDQLHKAQHELEKNNEVIAQLMQDESSNKAEIARMNQENGRLEEEIRELKAAEQDLPKIENVPRVLESFEKIESRGYAFPRSAVAPWELFNAETGEIINAKTGETRMWFETEKNRKKGT